jgi:hypothetical protein
VNTDKLKAVFYRTYFWLKIRKTTKITLWQMLTFPYEVQP